MEELTTAAEVGGRIKTFNRRYADDWSDWLRLSQSCDFTSGSNHIFIADNFKRIMGKWQACRPRPLRNIPELKQTLDSAAKFLAVLESADLRCFQAPGIERTDAIVNLWQVFADGLCCDGKATEVGISKAIMLVTKGRIGPAFDSNVKAKLNAYVIGPYGYLQALSAIAKEVEAFERRECTDIEVLAKEVGRPAAVGRIVDMILGPR